MSFLTAFDAREKRATVTIAWPQGGPSERAVTDPREHSGFGVASQARVMTERGPVEAGALVPGDRLCDGHGGHVTLAAAIRLVADLGAERVRVRAGALGEGLPAADLVVGRRTRFRLRSDLAQRLVGRRDVLVAAEALLHLDGVSLVPAVLDDVTHLVFEEHAMAVIEDVVVETLVPSAPFMESLPHRQLASLYAALPKLRYDGAFATYQTGLPELDAREARQVLTAPSTFAADPGSVGLVGNPEGSAPPCLARGTSEPSAPSRASGLSPSWAITC